MSNEQMTSSGYDKRDINLRAIIIVGSVIVLLIAVFLIVLRSLFVLSSEKMVQDVVLRPESTALRELRARETETLTSYKVLDPEKKVYRIPVSRAMELIAEEAYRAQHPGAQK